MNTVTQFSKHVFAQTHSKMNMEQRGFYFIAGLGSIVAAMANPPESMLWMAVLNVLGIGLVTLSILGKRLFSTRTESGLVLEPKQVTSIFTGIVGIGLSVMAIAMPPASLMLVFYVHALAVLLVSHAILDADSLMSKKSNKPVYSLPADENVMSDHVMPMNKAA